MRYHRVGEVEGADGDGGCEEEPGVYGEERAGGVTDQEEPGGIERCREGRWWVGGS